ncbi:MAG: hypothetical protein EAZ27_00830, partial [Cytophagales bacterium]
MKKNIIYSVLMTVCCHLAQAQNGGEWKVKSSLTTNGTLIGARFAPVGFSINGKGYYGTGSIYNQNDKFKDFWSYDPITDRWTQIADFGGTARSSCFAFALNGNGYVGGGKTDNGCSDEMFVYYPSSNSWGSYGLVPKALTSATGRAGAFATAIQEAGSAYIGGGGDTEFNAGLVANYYKDFWEFKPSRYDVWRRLPDMPNVNKDAAIVGKQFIPYPGFLAQQLYVFCGDEKDQSYTNKIWKYQGTSTQNGVWDVLSTSYPGGNILRPVAFKSNDDNYYVGSGLINVNNLNYSATNNFYKFNPTSQTFCEVANLPEARFASTGFAISNNNGNKGYVLGGLSGNPISSYTTQNSNFEYSPLAITTTSVSAITTCTSLNLNFTADCSYSGNITAELVTVSGSTVTTVSGVLGSATAGSAAIITLNFNSTIKPGFYRVRLKATTCASLVSSPSSFVLTITNATTNLPPASISLFGNVCSGRFIPASITSSLGINYAWTVSGGASLVSSATRFAIITGISNTTFSIRVGRLSTLCGISDIISTSGLGMLTSNTPSLSGPSQFCTNQTVVYSGGNSGHANGGYYQISKIGVGTLSQFSANQANFISSVAGVVTLNCSFVSACPSNATTPLIATIINTIPTNLSILGSNSLCANTQNVYTIPMIPNATYVWSVTGAASIIATSSNNCTLAGLGAGSFLLSVRISNFCGTITNTLAGISRGVLAIPTIIGLNTICTNSIITYSVATQTGANYLWNVSNNATIVGGNTSNVVSILVLNGTNATLSVQLRNECATVNGTYMINVFEKPVNPVINGCSDIILGNNCAFNASSSSIVNGYTWILGSSSISSNSLSGQNINITGNTNGIYQVYLKSNTAFCESNVVSVVGIVYNNVTLCGEVFYSNTSIFRAKQFSNSNFIINEFFFLTPFLDFGNVQNTTLDLQGQNAVLDGSYYWYFSGNLYIKNGTLTLKPGTRIRISSDSNFPNLFFTAGSSFISNGATIMGSNCVNVNLQTANISIASGALASITGTTFNGGADKFGSLIKATSSQITTPFVVQTSTFTNTNGISFYNEGMGNGVPQDYKILNNNFNHNKFSAAIYISTQAYNTVSGIEIKGNTIKNLGGPGVEIPGISYGLPVNTDFRCNLFTNCTRGIFVDADASRLKVQGSQSVATGNKFVGNAWDVYCSSITPNTTLIGYYLGA